MEKNKKWTREDLENAIMDSLKSLESEGFFPDAVDSDKNLAIPPFRQSGNPFRQSGKNQLGIPRQPNSPKFNTPPSKHMVDPSPSSLRDKYSSDLYDSINILKEFC